jgi:hypothetical protein
MASFIFCCPDVGLPVQGFAAEDESVVTGRFVAVECVACKRLHFVDPTTGQTLRERKKIDPL